MINSHDLDAMLAMVTDDFELVESATLPGAAHESGVEGMRRYALGWERNWSDWEMTEVELRELPPDHAVLVADLRLRGLHSGIDVSRRWIYLLRIRDGRIAAQIGFDDIDSAIYAVGSALGP